MLNEDDHLESVQDTFKAQEEQNESGLNNFRNASNVIEYKAALQQMRFLKDPEAVKKGIQLLKNKQEDVTVRALVLQKALSSIGKNLEYIRDCLSILQDKTDRIELRKGAFSVLKVFNFGSRLFASLRPEYMAILRSLLDDPDANLREMAAEELAKNKDEYVQRRLLNGLTGQQTPIVSEAKAIQLLGYDIHAEYYPVVRRLLQNPESDDVTKLEAIHVLANDPESKQLLVNLMLDKKQDKELRMSSAIAVRSGHPQDFTQIGKALVLDESENNDLRTVVLNALTLLPPAEKAVLHEDRRFLEKVSRLHTSTKSPELKKMSSRFLESAGRHRKQ
jgi:hypothetical protein